MDGGARFKERGTDPGGLSQAGRLGWRRRAINRASTFLNLPDTRCLHEAKLGGTLCDDN
jgi:hypothetical protein